MVRCCLDAVGRTESNSLLRCNGGHADSWSRRTDIVVWFSIFWKNDPNRILFPFMIRWAQMASIRPKLSELIAYNSRMPFFCWLCSMKDSWDYFLGNPNMLSGGFSPFNYVQECKGGHFRPLVLTLGCSPSPCGPPLLPIAFTLIIVLRKRTASHRQSNSLAGVDGHCIQ